MGWRQVRDRATRFAATEMSCVVQWWMVLRKKLLEPMRNKNAEHTNITLAIIVNRNVETMEGGMKCALL